MPTGIYRHRLASAKRRDAALGSHRQAYSKALALALNYVFIDSGAMYRAVTLYLMRCAADLNDTVQLEKVLDRVSIEFGLDNSGVSFVMLNGENVENEIRNISVASKVSEVAKIKAVRDKLVLLQQQMGEKKRRCDGWQRHRHHRFSGC